MPSCSSRLADWIIVAPVGPQRTLKRANRARAMGVTTRAAFHPGSRGTLHQRFLPPVKSASLCYAPLHLLNQNPPKGHTMSIHVTPPGSEAVIRATDATAPCARRVERWVLMATILGSSLAFIDGTVVNVALPMIQRDCTPPSRTCSGWSRRTRSFWRR